MFKKLCAALVLVFLLPSVCAFAESDYTIEDAYYECKAENPEFVDSILSKGVTDAQFIYFIQSIFDYMEALGDAVTRENYKDYIPDAIDASFRMRKNIKIRDTLTSTYPDAVVDAKNGIVPEEFRPLYETLKRIIFEHNLLNLAPRIDSVDAYSAGENVVVNAKCGNVLNEAVIAAAYDKDGTLLRAARIESEDGSISLNAPGAVYVKVMCFESVNALLPVCGALTVNLN